MKKENIVSVAVSKPLWGLFTYKLRPSDHCEIGARVVVPFRNRLLSGYVIKKESDFEGETLFINSVLDKKSIFPEPLFEALLWASEYYCYPLGMVLKSSHPPLEEQMENQRYFLTEKAEEYYYNYKAKSSVYTLSSPDEVETDINIIRLIKNWKNGSSYLRKTLLKRGYKDSLINKALKQGLITTKNILSKRGISGLEKAVSLVKTVKDEKVEQWLKRSKQRDNLYRELCDSHLPLPLSSLKKNYKNALHYIKDYEKMGLIDTEMIASSVSSLNWNKVEKYEPPKTLTDDQKSAIDIIIKSINKFGVYLLQGITGSGKTEVYLQVIEYLLKLGKSAIIIVPEIALTPQLSARFRGRLGSDITILHSQLTQSERAIEWRRISENKVSIVVGARSAIFAPLRNPGIFIVDEEHDPSFKQQDGFKYNARDFAVIRAQKEGIPVILGSATPSMESRRNAKELKYSHIIMSMRPTPMPLPEVEIVDLKIFQTKNFFTSKLIEAIKTNLENHGQTILFLNRRGFSGKLQCDSCGEVLMCPNCSVSMTFHKKQRRAVCHYCGYVSRETEKCTACGNLWSGLNLGTEKILDVIKDLFPKARVERMDRDSVKLGGVTTLYEKMKNGEIDILLGTQMVTKGHDFPGVTLVGVLDADHSLWFQDFRSSERTFQLLVQVAGRAGRGENRGKVIIQTRNPSHHSIYCAAKQDFELFFEKEYNYRSELNYPPSGFIVLVKFEGASLPDVIKVSEEAANKLRTGPYGQDITLIGPVEAPVSLINGKNRWQFIIKSKSRAVLHKLISEEKPYLASKRDSGVNIIIDVDPQSML